MPDISREALEGRWIHSHEEDGPGRTVFRPPSWNLPPSRGRRSFTLGPGGQLLSGTPGPTDKTVEAVGRWRLLPEGVVELEPQGGSGSRLNILELGPDKLVVER